MSKDIRIKINVVRIIIAIVVCFAIGYGIGKLIAIL